MAAITDTNMAYGNMTIQELAQMLGADLRRVERMVQRGEIPCQKVSGQLRVNRMEIHQWLHCEMGSMQDKELAGIDTGMSASRKLGVDEVLVAPLLRTEAVSVDLGARTKSSALRRLVALAEKTGLVWSTEDLIDGVTQRENIGSTAMEGGVAVPHPLRPLPYALAEPILVIARTAQPIVFGADSGGLTQLFFLTASQDSTQHLHLLARLCRLLRDGSLIEALLDAESQRQMLEIVIQAEADLIAKSL